jgi:hypothetical protein
MTEVTSERRVWKNKDGVEQGYTVNFRGGCTITHSYEYVCLTCHEHSVIKHQRNEDMTHHKCTKCESPLSRFISAPPGLDADFHDSCRSYNIGWDEENGIS